MTNFLHYPTVWCALCRQPAQHMKQAGDMRNQDVPPIGKSTTLSRLIRRVVHPLEFLEKPKTSTSLDQPNGWLKLV